MISSRNNSSSLRPPMNDPSDATWNVVEAWVHGDQAAAHELDRRFRGEVLKLIRSRRNPRFRQAINSEAIANDVMYSFLLGVAKQKFPEVNVRKDILVLLRTIAVRSLADAIRAETAQKRDVRREVNGQIEPREFSDHREPSPDEKAQFAEYLVQLPEIVRGVHPKSMDILELSLEGLKPSEIAQELGIGVRTVQQTIKRMIGRWEDWLDEE